MVTILTDNQASTERGYINRDQIKKTIQCISSAITQGLARQLKVGPVGSEPRKQRAGVWFRTRSNRPSHVSRSGSSLVVAPNQTKLHTDPTASARVTGQSEDRGLQGLGWLNPPSRTYWFSP